jgi:hypothetical protein
LTGIRSVVDTLENLLSIQRIAGREVFKGYQSPSWPMFYPTGVEISGRNLLWKVLDIVLNTAITGHFYFQKTREINQI